MQVVLVLKKNLKKYKQNSENEKDFFFAINEKDIEYKKN